jgi:hypothetical protein
VFQRGEPGLLDDVIDAVFVEEKTARQGAYEAVIPQQDLWVSSDSVHRFLSLWTPPTSKWVHVF